MYIFFKNIYFLGWFRITLLAQMVGDYQTFISYIDRIQFCSQFSDICYFIKKILSVIITFLDSVIICHVINTLNASSEKNCC